ncbi:hypothetical protein N7516_002109 [Penicillium verrucosum]|uniref:uncharacterized protein n=1 Tax=Penicillium verrucosum TaxID=60171 RepID=UPI00254540BE|nr:uncharacterized protein N7516_002109 [Penicillium verrucosum]KAJ5941941.1 hypothetical protein N7516_002109 [Penicillium verrucosum]
MSSTSNEFGDKNLGTQVGVNHGQIYFSSAPRETPQQNIDNGSHHLVPVKETMTNYVEVLRSLAFPQMLDRRDNIEPCHPDTCQWILELEKYKSWRSQSRGLLWIKGKPGAGKSTLMLFLHDKLKNDMDHGIRLEFFFTARGTEMQRIPLGMLRSLLCQIFDRDATARPQVREAYEQRCRQFGYGEREWEWPQVVLEELLAGTILASASRQHIMIFVDALDEAGAESAQYLAAYFHRLINRAEKMNVAVQICISCRHYPIMESDPAREIYIEHHNHDDIARYIKDIIVDTDVGDAPSQETREALTEQLIRQCNRVFQWAHLIMPLIRQKILEGESFDEIRCWLYEVPAGLEEVYTYILNNVIERRNRAQSLLLFQWVSLAERPLTVTETRYALVAQNVDLAFPPKAWERIDGFVESNGRMKRKIQALSGGLVEVISTENHQETVQVVHQSVADFLRAKGLGLLCHNIGTSMLPIDGEKIIFQCQATLYRTCLVYLATVHIPRKMLGEQAFIQDHPLIAYASHYVFIHAEKAAGSRADVLQNEQDILKQVIGPWTQICYIQDDYGGRRPPERTTILHVAAGANLVDVIESVVSNGEEITKKDIIGNTAFHLAARGGHITASKILLDKGADYEAKNKYGITPLTEAARCGHVRFVEWLLCEGANVETSARSGGALQAASLAGHQRVVVILLGAGADVNAPGGKYSNALQAAAFTGNTEIVQLLLEAQADVNAQGGFYGNALQAAAYNNGNTDTVELLLETQADVNAQGGYFGNALQAAAFNPNTEILQLLLEAQADVNAQGGEYGNALQAAAYNNGNTETVELLLEAQADVNAQGGEYGNALQAACATYNNGNTETVELLLEAQADVNAQGGYFGNALQAAAFTGNTEIVQLLLEAQADVNAQGGEYGNALQAACATYNNGNTETVELLLEAQADANTQGGYFGNALQAACATYNDGNTGTVQLILEAQADVNAQGGEYGNALQAACAIYNNGNTETVELLLEAQADVNAQGGYFGNALQAACATYNDGHTGTVQLLLEAQADVNAQGGFYGNALQAAAFNQNTEILQLLLEAQADVNAQGGEYGNALQAACATFKEHTEIVQMLLKSRAHINTQGGRHGLPLLAAVEKEDSDLIQILLQAGADVLLVNELDQTPLHIAAFANNLDLLNRFPLLASGINSRDKFLQTPLHLAICFGHIEFAEKLLHLGANPALPDGYGRNVLDWVVGNERLMHQIQNRCPPIVVTPKETQELTTRFFVLS